MMRAGAGLNKVQPTRGWNYVRRGMCWSASRSLEVPENSDLLLSPYEREQSEYFMHVMLKFLRGCATAWLRPAQSLAGEVCGALRWTMRRRASWPTK